MDAVAKSADVIAVRFAAQDGTLTMGFVLRSGAVRTLGSVYDLELTNGRVGLLEFPGIRGP
jgi:hypothetical protein